MIDTYLEYDAEPDNAVFHVRLGLSVADLATDVRDLQPVIRTIAHTITDAADAYAAHETLASGLPLVEPVTQALNELVRPAGLNIAMPPAQLANLMQAVQTSETTITRLLAMTPKPNAVANVNGR
jgi:hypothetical protein